MVEPYIVTDGRAIYARTWILCYARKIANIHSAIVVDTRTGEVKNLTEQNRSEREGLL